MMNNKKMKAWINGTIFLAVAALGVAVYQISTSPLKEHEEIYELPVKKEEVVENTEIFEEEEAEEFLEESGSEENVEEEGIVASALVEEDLVPMEEDLVSMEEDGYGIDLDGADADVASAVIVEPEIHFSEETLMEWPVNGTILLDYNMDQSIYFPTLDQYRRSSAIAVQAVEGAPVLAAAAGKVFEICEDSRTGTTVTMELGDGYQAIYGQLKDVMVEKDDYVKKGEMIGYIGMPTKYYSLEGSNLYFAMKKDGAAIDPIIYLP